MASENVLRLTIGFVPFTADPVCRVAMVMPEEKEVLLLFYKHRAE